MENEQTLYTDNKSKDYTFSQFLTDLDAYLDKKDYMDCAADIKNLLKKYAVFLLSYWMIDISLLSLSLLPRSLPNMLVYSFYYLIILLASISYSAPAKKDEQPPAPAPPKKEEKPVPVPPKKEEKPLKPVPPKKPSDSDSSSSDSSSDSDPEPDSPMDDAPAAPKKVLFPPSSSILSVLLAAPAAVLFSITFSTSSLWYPLLFLLLF